MRITTITMTELRRHLVAYCDRAYEGEVFLITRYGKPVAMLVPPNLVEGP